MIKEKLKRYYITTYRFLTVVLMSVLMSNLLYFLPIYSNLLEFTEEDLYVKTPFLISIFLMVPFFYSLVRQTVIYNEPIHDLYIESGVKNTLKENFRFIFKKREIWLKAFIFTVIYMILPLKWTFRSLDVLFQTEKLKALAVLFPVLFILYILAHLSAIRFWRKDKYNLPEDNKKAYSRGTTFVFIIYATSAILLNILVSALVSLTPVFEELLKLVLNPAVLVIVFILVVFPPVIRMIRASSKRKSCIKRLKEICEEKGYQISEINDSFKNLIKIKKGESFTVTVGDKCYSCKFISAKRKNTPLAIYSNGICAFIYSITLFKIRLFQFSRKYHFGYESEHKKILILNPAPKSVLTNNGNGSYQIDNGEIVGKYKVYTATAFMNALDRKVLDK